MHGGFALAATHFQQAGGFFFGLSRARPFLPSCFENTLIDQRLGTRNKTGRLPEKLVDSCLIGPTGHVYELLHVGSSWNDHSIRRSRSSKQQITTYPFQPRVLQHLFCLHSMSPRDFACVFRAADFQCTLYLRQPIVCTFALPRHANLAVRNEMTEQQSGNCNCSAFDHRFSLFGSSYAPRLR